MTVISKIIIFTSLILGCYSLSYAYELPKVYGIIHVTDYGAVPDDGLDDTEAIQNAIEYAKSLRLPNAPAHNVAKEKHFFVVYIPAGIYNISNTLYIDDSPTEQQSYRIKIMGENVENTVIKLKDACSGFLSVANPKPMWRTINAPKSNKSQNYSLEDITFDIGAGNPGAIGLDHHSNNLGSVRSVNIVCNDLNNKGVIGFKFDRETGGIIYVKDIFVKGFKTGIKTSSGSIDMVFEDIVLEDCNTGFSNNQKGIQLKNYVSRRVDRPVYQTALNASMVLLDSYFNDGADDKSAIIRDAGELYLRNVSSNGFKDVYAPVAANTVDEYVHGNRYSLWASQSNGSLKLPVLTTPSPVREPLEDWVIIDCDAQGDDTEVIQNAIDDGAKTIFLSGKDNYTISSPIVIGNNLERFHGGWGKIWFGGTGNTKSALLIETGNHESTIIEGFSYIHGIKNNSSKTVVIQASWISHISRPYETIAQNPGDLFLDELCPRWSNGNLPPLEGTAMVFKNQNVFVRDLNIEGFSNPIIAENTNLWLYGFKFGEHMSDPAIHASKGSNVEVLGGLLNGPTAKGRNLFVCDNSQMSIVGVFSKNGFSSATEGVFVRETQNDTTRTLKSTSLSRRSASAFHCPLFVSKIFNDIDNGIIVNAGFDLVLTELPVGQVVFTGTVMPADSVVAVNWTKTEGPDCVLDNQNTLNLLVLNPAEGDYTFRLTVFHLNGDSAFDDVKLRVICEPCHTPEVLVNSDRIVRLPLDTLQLNGLATVQQGSIVEYNWTLISDTEPVMAGTDTTLLVLSDLSEGVYEFLFTAKSDKGYSGSAIVTVTVLASPEMVFKKSGVITIDGIKESAWCGSFYEIDNIVKGFDNNNAEATFLWDDDCFYVFVEVDDPFLMNDSGDEWWDDDAVEIYIDAGNSKGVSFGDTDFRYGFRWHWNVANMDMYEEANGAVSGVEWAIKEFGQGYTLETKIPWTTLNHLPSEGGSIGVEIRVLNDDDGGGNDAIKALFGFSEEHTPVPQFFGTFILGETCTKTFVSVPDGFNGIRIYPNLTNDKIFIENNKEAPVMGQIMDIMGKKITEFECHDNTVLSLNSYISGVYFIVFNQDGVQRTIKIIKR